MAKRKRIIIAAFIAAVCLTLSGCLFGGDDGEEQTTAGTQTEAPVSEQGQSGQESRAASQPESEEVISGPVTKEMVADDLEEAVSALTGREGASNAHLLGADGQPIESFSYNGGAAIVAPYIRISVDEVTGEDGSAEAVLLITSPDLMPLIEKAVEGMETLDEAEMNANLEKLLAAGGYKETTYTVQTELKYIDGNWYIEQNEEFQNALSGGLFDLERAAAPKKEDLGQ